MENVLFWFMMQVQTVFKYKPDTKCNLANVVIGSETQKVILIKSKAGIPPARL